MAVSFLMLASSKSSKGNDSSVFHWRKQGFKLSPSTSSVLLVICLPLLSLIHFKEVKSVILILPVLTLCLCSLIEIVKRD